MDWPSREGHPTLESLAKSFGEPSTWPYYAPHTCSTEGCPGPKLVAKLKAAGALRVGLGHVAESGHRWGSVAAMDCRECGKARRAVTAWDAAK